MFDLDIIEQDWKDNSFCLSEQEIIEIYRSEGVTKEKYDKEVEEYKNKFDVGISAADKLLAQIFGDSKIREKLEYQKKLEEENPFPSRKRLSNEAQKKVVEGSLNIVFDSTREWYEILEEKVHMEDIYFICLESLIKSVRYMVHCEKPIFSLYVSKSIENNITKYISKIMNIDRYQSNILIQKLKQNFYNSKVFKPKDKYFNYEDKEEIEKPSKIFYKLKDKLLDVHYIEQMSSNEFMNDYYDAIQHLEEIDREVMQLSFDIYGYRGGLTDAEIADYIGIDSNKISNIRKRSIRTLRKNKKLLSYLPN